MFLQGSGVGAAGAELLFNTDSISIRLAIENENETLKFRENLSLLAHSPGLRLRVIGRLDLQNPNVVFPLALGPRVDVDLEAEAASAQAKKSGRVVPTDKAPTLDLPDALDGRVFLGFDELQRKHLTNSVDMPTVLPRLGDSEGDDPLDPLARRWIAAMLSGESSQRQGVNNTITTEIARLTNQGYITGVGLMDLLARGALAETRRCLLGGRDILARLPP